MAEYVIGLYKAEVIRRKGPWKNSEDVEFKTLEWVDWFNTRRLLEPIGYVPPVEYEAMYYQQQMAPVMVGGVKYFGLRDSRGGSRRDLPCIVGGAPVSFDQASQVRSQ